MSYKFTPKLKKSYKERDREKRKQREMIQTVLKVKQLQNKWKQQFSQNIETLVQKCYSTIDMLRVIIKKHS